MKFLEFNKPNSDSWKYSYNSLYYYVNIMLYFPLWPMFLSKKHANFISRAYVCLWRISSPDIPA